MITYVAPATTNSIDFALVEPDKIAINMEAAAILTQSRAGRLLTYIQIMTGTSSSVTMSGVMRTRAILVIDSLGDIWTFGSLETLLP